MSMLLKKLVLSFLAFTLLFVSIAPNLLVVKAAPATAPVETWYNSSFANWYGKVYDPSNPSEIFGERYTAAQVQWIIYGIWSFLINATTGPQNAGAISCLFKSFGSSELDLTCIPDPGTTAVPQTKPVASNQNLWSAVFADRPISGISYVKERAQNFSLVPAAHAQTVGFGYKALEPVQLMWKTVRDISFGFFVIIAVVFAFMIMFRVKLNPQTAITVQSAIPKIIFSLILVTFSYAIAGFLIDFMYVVIGLISVIGSQFMITLNLGGTNITAWSIFNFLTLGAPININVQFGVAGLIAVYIWMFFNAFVLVFLLNIGLLLTAVLALPLAPVLIILAILVIIVMVILVFWFTIKTMWALIKAFASVILLTIFAPIQITLGTFIPNFGFGSWLRSYLAALSTFVVTGALILFAYIFVIQGVFTAVVGIAGLPGSGSLVNVLMTFPRLILGSSNPVGSQFAANSAGWPPLLGNGSGQFMGLLLIGVSFVLFTLIPKATQIVQGFITGKQFAYGTAIGEAMGPINWAAGTAYKQSGAADVVGLIQQIRQARNLQRALRYGPVRRGVEFVAGGPEDDRKAAVEKEVDRYIDKSGGQRRS